MSRHRECQTDIHSARKVFDWGIKQSATLRELDNLVEFTPNLAALHPQHSAVEEDVLSPRQFRVKAGSYLKKSSDAATNLRNPLSWFRDSRKYLQKGGLSRSIAPDDTKHFAVLHFQREISEGPKFGFLPVETVGRL